MGEPDGAVAAKGADLKDAASVVDAGEEMKELALRGGDVDGREAGGGVGGEGLGEGGVGGDELLSEVLVDGCPELLIGLLIHCKRVVR